jgi:hypothetical protein
MIHTHTQREREREGGERKSETETETENKLPSLLSKSIKIRPKIFYKTGPTNDSSHPKLRKTKKFGIEVLLPMISKLVTIAR